MLLLLSGTMWGQPPHQLWTQATVYRDGWGVPHVYADNPRALAFAFGYAQAEDRLEAVIRAYRIATGRAAAVFGPDYADSDAFALKMGHGDLAVWALESAPPLTRDLCEGFALGINAWIADHPAHVPDWADGAQPADVLALMHCYLMSFAPFDLPGVFHRPAPSFSGNAWALGPPLTQSGDAVLVLNPHGYYDGPFQWYEAHLAGTGVNVAGATLCGLPVILQGHNEVLGWALTPNYPDFADIYIQPEGEVQLPAGDPNKMQLEATLERLLIGRRLVESRTFFVNAPGGMRQRSAPFHMTSRGPVVGEVQGEPCSFMAGGYADFGTLEQLMAMGAAQNLGEFQRALARRQLPCFHVTYADREGNIFYLYNVKVGDKTLPPAMALAEQPEGEEEGGGPPGAFYVWDAPLPANDFHYAWGELVPLDGLPALLNPPAGYIQACGTPPWAVTGDSGIDPATVPPWLANDRDTFRAQRVRHLLSMGQRSFQEAQAMVYDVLVPFATAAVPQLLAWADGRENFLQSAHPDTGRSLDVLRSWNFVADTGSTGMTVFNAWWTAYRQMAGPDVPDAVLYEEFMSAAPRVQNCALDAVSNASREMRNLHDALEVPWGDVHRFRKGQTEKPIAGGLAGEPVMVTGDYGAARRKLVPGYGYAYAMAVQFGDTPESVSVMPGGISDTPDSKHFADQLTLFSERRFKVNYFLDKDVQRFAERAFGRRVTLRPVGMQGVFAVDARDPVSVHLEASAEMPAPLPDGMAAYTVFVTPVLDQPRTPITIDAAIYVPPSVLERGGIEQLAVHVLNLDYGWLAVAGQRVNAETRIFRARFEGAHTCAVLGPAVLRARMAAQPEQVTPEGQAPPETSAPAAEESGLAPAPETLSLAEEAPPGDRPEAPAELIPDETGETPEAPRPRLPEPAPVVPSSALAVHAPEGAARSGLAWGRTLEIAIPGDAGMVRVQGEKSLGVFASASAAAPAPLPEGWSPVTPFVGVHCSDPAVAVTVQLELSVASVPAAERDAAALFAYRPETGWEELSEHHLDVETGAMIGSDSRPGVYAVLKRGAGTVAQPMPMEQRAEPISGETVPVPETPVVTQLPEQPESPQPVSNPAPSGPRKPTLAWGRAVELASENGLAHFAIDADASLGAFTKVLTEPPAPLPEGLRACGSFIALSLSKRDVPVRVEIVMYPDGSLPAGADIASLALYAYDADSGWTRMEPQQTDRTLGAISASDTQPRTYALLMQDSGSSEQ